MTWVGDSPAKEPTVRHLSLYMLEFRGIRTFDQDQDEHDGHHAECVAWVEMSIIDFTLDLVLFNNVNQVRVPSLAYPFFIPLSRVGYLVGTLG